MLRPASWLLRLVRRADGRDAGGVVTVEVATPPEQVEAYWTDERMRDARPREVRRPVGPLRREPPAPDDAPPAG